MRFLVEGWLMILFSGRIGFQSKEKSTEASRQKK